MYMYKVYLDFVIGNRFYPLFTVMDVLQESITFT